MQIFIDTADIEEIRDAAAMGVIDGVTTNPSLVAKTGRALQEVLVDICEVVDGPISAEVIATDYEGMLKEARALAKMHENIVVKIPLIAEGLKTVRTLTDEGIRTNVTLCFSPTQGLLAAKAGATYISPFIGRIDDISGNGMELVEQLVTIYQNYGLEHTGPRGEHSPSRARRTGCTHRRPRSDDSAQRDSPATQAPPH